MSLDDKHTGWKKISEFDFEVVYVPGSENVVADALSCLYSADSPGTVHTKSEYTYFDVVNKDNSDVVETSVPVLAGIEARIAVQKRLWKALPGAETGWPETVREFAARMKSHFVLKPPAKRKEGKSGKTQTTPTVSAVNAGKLKIKIPTCTKNSATLLRSDKDLQPSIKIDAMAKLSTSDPVAYPSLLNVISESQDGVDFLKELKGRYIDDPLFKVIVDNPWEHRNFHIENQLVYLKDQEQKLLCIPNVLIRGRNAHEIILSKVHSLLAHLGASKTLYYLRDHLWWKTMVSDTKAFCESCMTCKRSKPSNQKPYGLLNPLPVPTQPWEAIGIDFVGLLPESKNRDGNFDSIMVIICLLTAMVHLVPSWTTYNARQIAELMFEEVYKLHGLPKHIISD